MAYSEQLAGNIRSTIRGQRGWQERKMFGGLCFTLHGHMCCGINGDALMLRMGEERAQAALRKPHVRVMDFTGRPLKGMVYVTPNGFKSATALKSWIDLASEFVRSLPAKDALQRRTRKQLAPTAAA